MPNVVDRLFDTIEPSLKDAPEIEYPAPKSDIGADALDEPPDSPNDGVVPIDDAKRGREVGDILTGRPGQWGLDDDTRERIEGGVRRRGFDVLAFYKSKRFSDDRPFPGKWGIFYIYQGMLYIEEQIRNEYPGFGKPFHLALDFLRIHETFHYRADLQTLLFEAVTGYRLYERTKKLFRYQQSHFVEEALANRQVWDWARRPAVGLREFAYEFMSLQPNAYSRFSEPRLELSAEWAANVLDGSLGSLARRHDLAHWVESSPKDLLRRSLCPEYVVYPANVDSWLPAVLVLPPVLEVFEDEKMSKRLRSKYRHLKEKWEETKAKMLESRVLRGLNFKPWPKDGPDCYSVKVDSGNRAHLRHEGRGQWKAYDIGSHKEMGHG